MDDLLTRVQTEADQCRNDGADDIARLLDEVVARLQIQGRQLFETEGRASTLARELASAQGCISAWIKFGSDLTDALGVKVLSPKDMLQEIARLRGSPVDKSVDLHGKQVDETPNLQDQAELPPAYMLAKLQMVMPVMQEARDALTAITEAQRKARGISPTLADRMDVAGTFSLDDWKAQQLAQEGLHA